MGIGGSSLADTWCNIDSIQLLFITWWEVFGKRFNTTFYITWWEVFGKTYHVIS
jgi:hypothetical protein